MQRAERTTRVEIAEVGHVGKAIESADYFCCLEASQNAAKYAALAATAQLALHRAGQALRFRVCDDGVRIGTTARAADGYGLARMRAWLPAVGGRLGIEASCGAFSVVRAVSSKEVSQF